MSTPESVKAFHAVCPPTISAAALIRGCRLSMDAGHQEMAWRTLKNMWLPVSAALKAEVARNPMSQLASAALMLEAYFGCNGDWSHMERTLTEASAEFMPFPVAEALIAEMATSFVQIAKAVAEKEAQSS